MFRIVQCFHMPFITSSSMLTISEFERLQEYFPASESMASCINKELMRLVVFFSVNIMTPPRLWLWFIIWKTLSRKKFLVNLILTLFWWYQFAVFGGTLTSPLVHVKFMRLPFFTDILGPSSIWANEAAKQKFNSINFSNFLSQVCK